MSKCNQNWWYAWLQGKHRSIIKGDHVQIPFKLAANLWKALKSEIFYERNFLRLRCHWRIWNWNLKVLWKAFLLSIWNRLLAGCEYAWVKRPYNYFKYGTRLSAVYAKWHCIYLVPDCKCVMVKFYEEHNTLLSYDCKTSFATKILDPLSVT